MPATATTTATTTTTLRRFALDVADRPDVLPRVLGLCLRRGCELQEVRFTRAAGPATLELAVHVGPRHAGPLPARLDALVDVLAVRELP